MVTAGVVHMTPAPQSNDVVSPDELKQLHAQIDKLLTHHQQVLDAEDVRSDVERILRWVERCEEGSIVAERKLYQEGISVLETVTSRLKLAHEEQLRLQDESPAVAAKSQSRQAERFSKAARNANKALSTLSTLNPSDKKH